MYLIDTNILIYHFNNTIPQKSKSKLNKIFLENFNISVITKMEFLGFKEHTDDSFNKASLFLSYSDIINLDKEIINTVIKLKRIQKIKLPDAIIAATAIKQNLILVTRNTADFNNINIKIYNPFEI